MSHVHYSGYVYDQLKPLITTMLECCRNPRVHHPAIFDKYTQQKFKCSSIFAERQLLGGFTLNTRYPVPQRLFNQNLMDEVRPAPAQMQCMPLVPIPATH